MGNEPATDERETFIGIFPAFIHGIAADFNLTPEDLGFPGDLRSYVAEQWDATRRDGAVPASIR